MSPCQGRKKEAGRAFGAYGKAYERASLPVTAYGIGKYLVKRLNMRGIERMEKTKLARIN
jgi:hypothetical protein